MTYVTILFIGALTLSFLYVHFDVDWDKEHIILTSAAFLLGFILAYMGYGPYDFP
jgi:hypothetical protein